MNKDEGFWEEVKKWDVVMLSETWVDAKDWGRVKRKLPKGYTWQMQEAKKEKVKGRKKGGMVSGVRKELVGEKRIEMGFEETDGVMTRMVKIGRRKVRVVCVYRRRGEEEGWGVIRKWVAKKDDELVLIGGDMNAWTGEQGGEIWDEETETFRRKSKHKQVDQEGRNLLEILGESGWFICNGNSEGDEEGEITFAGKGETVIDYILAEERIRRLLERMEVGNEIGSEHFPVIATLKCGNWRREGRKKEGATGKKAKMGKWGVDKLREYTERMEEENVVIEDGVGVDEMLCKMRGRVEKIVEEIRPSEEERRGKRGWWDAECVESKERMKSSLKIWRRGEIDRKEYNKRKREHEKLLDGKRREEKARYMEEVEKAIKEGREWEVINRERSGWKGINEEISMDEWTVYFKKLLGGVDNKVRGEGRKNKEGGMEGGNELTREEVNQAIEKLKRNKATGEDGMENEALKFGGRRVREEIWEVCNRVWRGEGWPKEWRTGLVVPLLKKGGGRKVEDYRGITLMPVTYKIYAEVLRKRLEEQVEEKESIPHNQTGFRKGMGTVDNIFVLNYLVNRNLGQKKGKLVALFVDFKAAFDSVNRKVLWKAMKERGVDEELIDRIKEVFTETKTRVRIGEQKGEEFWTGRGLRQGCPLSPLLFSILLADLEEKMERKGKGGTVLGNKRIYSLAYADDVVLLAESESGMNLLMKGFEEYVREKDLTMNVTKTKIVCFRKRKNEVKYEWKINGEMVEMVEEFCYLGFWFEAGGGNDLQVKKRIESASKVMGQVWGIGKRRFKEDWKMRVWLFDSLVWSVMCYGVEIWGWKEYKRVENMQERFLRWVMGVSWSCPGYMLREETGREKLVIRQRKRVWNFEGKLKNGKGSKVAQACLQEILNRERRGNTGHSRWEEERWQVKREWRMWDEGREWQEIEREMSKKQEEKRWEKIIESKYNKWYRLVKMEGVPEYLGKLKKECRWSRMVRFRMGEGMNECKYWMNEEMKMCRVCGYERESWEHVLERCTGEEEGEKSVAEKVMWILNGCGQGEKWMKSLEEKREERMHGGGKNQN